MRAVLCTAAASAALLAFSISFLGWLLGLLGAIWPAASLLAVLCFAFYSKD